MSERKLSILCVDDEELPLKLRKLVLEKQGFEVITARSAASAMEIFEQSQIDLVLTDQLMPGGTGVELARKVKAARPEMPVVLISGVNEIPPDADAADLFISKIEGPARMFEKIAALLAKWGGRAEEQKARTSSGAKAN